jgi:hypothetical protein
MNEISKFLKRRAEGIARDNLLKEKSSIPESDEQTEQTELSDREFWWILKQFNLEIRSGEKDPVTVLEEIFEEYSSHQIKQFADRYEQLNS